MPKCLWGSEPCCVTRSCTRLPFRMSKPVMPNSDIFGGGEGCNSSPTPAVTLFQSLLVSSPHPTPSLPQLQSIPSLLPTLCISLCCQYSLSQQTPLNSHPMCQGPVTSVCVESQPGSAGTMQLEWCSGPLWQQSYCSSIGPLLKSGQATAIPSSMACGLLTKCKKLGGKARDKHLSS